jgi:hypothetical protein
MKICDSVSNARVDGQMGSILHLTSRRSANLSSRQVIGRSRKSDLVIASRRVSAEHAIMAWSGVNWVVRDLGSTNGTFVDGKPLLVGEKVHLRRNSLLAFGDSEDAWRLVSDSPPLPVVIDVATGLAVESEGPILGIPSAQDPSLMVYWANHGWMVEQDGNLHSLLETIRVTVSGRMFEIQFPEALDRTIAEEDQPPNRDEPLSGFRFTFRRDGGGGIGMDAEGRSGPLSLRPRAHHVTMLHLAQRRMNDIVSGVEPMEAGWMPFDQTAQHLGVDPKTLNVHIYRVREELAHHGVCGASAVVERRPQTRELRFGSNAVTIFDA